MKLLSVYAVLLLVGVAACNSNRGVSVADVNGRSITQAEFAERYEKYRAQTSERDNIVLRKKILNNMVDEILILDDLHVRGVDQDSATGAKLEDIREQALLDGFAKRLTVDTMTVSEGELREEFRAFNTKASARFVYAKTQDEAARLREELSHGVSFSSLAKDVFADPTLAGNGGYLGFFGYGDMEPALQRAAFSLPIGTLSNPIKLKMGYAIVKVEKRIQVPLSSELDYAKQKPKLEEEIRKRKMMQFLGEEGDRIMAELNPVFNQATLKMVFDQWHYVTNAEGTMVNNEAVSQNPEGLDSLPMVTFKGGDWKVKDFVRMAEKTRSKFRRKVKNVKDLQDLAEGLIMRQGLLLKAEGAALDEDGRVVLQKQLARQNYLLHRWASLAQDSVSSGSVSRGEMLAYYESHKDEFMDPPLVNVAEILVRTEKEARELRKELAQGADFGMLARTHSVRTYAAKRNGELGYVPPSSFGSVGGLVIRARVGDIIGPQFLDPFYCVLKILGKKPSRQRSFEESEKSIAQALLPDRKQKAFWDAVENLRSRANVQLHIEALGDVVIASN